MTSKNQPHRPTGYEPGDYPELTAAAVSYALEAKGISRDQVEIGMIWAQTTAGVIGDGADMPWYLPEDLKHFKNATTGYPVVMGRTSWEALDDGFRPLPGRTNYVITRQGGYDAPGGTIEPSIPSAVANAEHNLQLDPAALVVSAAYVDEGPTLKRIRPRAQGRAFRINKRTSHITVIVGDASDAAHEEGAR